MYLRYVDIYLNEISIKASSKCPFHVFEITPEVTKKNSI